MSDKDLVLALQVVEDETGSDVGVLAFPTITITTTLTTFWSTVSNQC